MDFHITGNLSEQIAGYLSEKIVQFELEPGQRILEQRISEELGVSRSPIREAIRILDKSGLVEIIPRCGAKVTKMSKNEVDGFCDVLSLLLCHLVRR